MIIYDPLYPSIKSGWYGRLRGFAATFASFGGNVIMLPPPFRTSYVGANNQSLGYDPVSDLDIGQWDVLRGGTAQDAQELALVAAAHGVRLMADLPIHQYGGQPPYIERNSKGQPDKTLAYKPVGVFDGAVDAVFDPNGGAADGIRVIYQNSRPNGYMLEMKKQCIAWLIDVMGLVGYREDEAKDESIATSVALNRANPGINVAEVMAGTNAEFDSYNRQTNMSVIDFGSHWAYVSVSNGAGLDALVTTERYCHANPGASMIVVENHDTNGPNGIVNNKGWFYFDALTQNAQAVFIYGEDYEVYGLSPLINNYCWIGSKLAIGNQTYRVVSPDVLIWERDGNGGPIGQSAGVVCGISRDPINTQWVWTDTHFRNCWLTNYAISGGPNVWVYDDGRACIPLPPNSWGRADNAVAYSTPGQDGPIQTKATHLTLTQPLDFSKVTVRYPL
jgi:hypothetical protein